MKMYFAHVKTESGDDYYYSFDYKPERSEIVKLVEKYENGEEYDYDYNEHLEIDIMNLKVISKGK